MHVRGLIVAVFVSFWLVIVPTLAGQAPPNRPRLIVILVVDQMRADHVDTYGARWSVPLVLMGDRVKSGAYLQDASPADIAPTLAAIAGITMTRAEGRVLTEALGAQPARSNTPSAR